MRPWWRKLRTLIGVQYAYMLEYRAELYLWALSGVMPFFLMGLWMKASAGGNLPRDPDSFARYFLAVFVVRQLTMVWVVWDVEYDVVNGRLSPLLLQPLNPFWRYLASHLAERLTRLPFLAVLVALFLGIYPHAAFVPSAAAAALALLAVTAAFALRFIMQYAFAMLAFWTERANAIEDLFFLLYLFLSGFLAPLELFPEPVRQIAVFTPFPYLIYLPAQLLTGAPANLEYGPLVMLGWGLVFLGLCRLGWHTGLRRYAAMGA